MRERNSFVTTLSNYTCDGKAHPLGSFEVFDVRKISRRGGNSTPTI